MNESSEEGINLNRGYDIGFVDYLKRAFELVGQLAEFYENGLKVSDDLSEEEKDSYENSNRGRANACRYAQQVIRKNSFWRRRFTLVIMNTIKEKYKTTLNHRLECIQIKILQCW